MKSTPHDTTPAKATLAPKVDLQVAHDTVSRVMSLLTEETNVEEEDRKTLLALHKDLEARRAMLEQWDATGSRRQDDSKELGSSEGGATPQDEDIAKAFEFTTFLSSLDPKDTATQLLFQGNNRTTAALQNVEKGGDFLENAPMQRFLDMYERLKSRETSLKAIKGPISTTNARIYLDEANGFADMVKEMIMLSLEVEDEGETSAADVKTA
ncbi:hypothetical protein B0H10DRAFT_2002861 [Mycena sp. CBHHK59/15]|nr:hypothetical protein B0H10DRAFT_2002861 [Mycena sp. CBHHK59/15]